MEKQRVISSETLRLRGRFTFPQSSQKNTEASCASLLKNSLSCLAKLGQFSQKGKQEPPKHCAKFVELFKEGFSFYRMLGGSRYM